MAKLLISESELSPEHVKDIYTAPAGFKRISDPYSFSGDNHSALYQNVDNPHHVIGKQQKHGQYSVTYPEVSSTHMLRDTHGRLYHISTNPRKLFSSEETSKMISDFTQKHGHEINGVLNNLAHNANKDVNNYRVKHGSYHISASTPSHSRYDSKHYDFQNRKYKDTAPHLKD